MNLIQPQTGATQQDFKILERWAQRHRRSLIDETLGLYDLNYTRMCDLYLHRQWLVPQALYRRRSFYAVSHLLDYSNYMAQLVLFCRMNLSGHKEDSMHLLSLRLCAYTDSQQLQLSSEDPRWHLDLGETWNNAANRRWLLGRYLYSILGLLGQRGVILNPSASTRMPFPFKR